MKRGFLILISVIFLVFFKLDVHAQSRLLRYADKQYDLENYLKASESYRKAFDRRNKYSTALKLAKTFDKFGSYENAYDWWTIVVGFEESTKEDYSNYLNSAIKIGKWDEIDQLLDDSGFTSSDYPELNLEGIRTILESPSTMELSSVDLVNTDASEFGISVDKYGNTYFSSDRGPIGDVESIPSVRLDVKNEMFSNEKSGVNEREYYKIYRKNADGSSSKVSSDLTDAMHYNDPHYSPELDLIFYTAFVGKKKIKGRKNFVNHAGIYFGKIDQSGNIIDSKPFKFNQHLDYGVMNPFVDQKSKRLYFASDMPGGLGGFDIYYSEFDDNLNFSAPVNLGPLVNTPYNESHPSVYGSKFYFTSRGHMGLGGMDIFVGDYINGNVDNIRNMGLPYNSIRDDFNFIASSDGKSFISSDRKGGKGLDDIYTLKELFKVLKVIVEDCNGDPITEFDSHIVDNLEKAIETELTKEGILIAGLNPEREFSLKISKKGYFEINDDSLTTIGFEGDTLVKRYKMAAIPYKTKLLSANVYYDFDKSNIRDSEKPTLERIGNLMVENPHTVLYVSSHTDSRASNAYNEGLSERRATSVNKYLTSLGISPERIKLEWFGEERPVNDCGDGQPCSESNHQLNRRSELTLTAFVDKDMEYELPEGIDNPCELGIHTDLLTSSGAEEIFEKDLEKAEIANELPTIFFDFDRSNLKPVQEKELDEVIRQMKSDTTLNLIIEGHTDQRGSDVYNEYLSELRAKTVMDYLIKNGIDRNRIEYSFYGENLPIHDCRNSNCSEALHKENRRTTLRWNQNVL
ncbi:OmpA family protein [Shivajiella indica]|uniref:OmpA family protein n=1 Tax=Shivajiella indica TaxID=872115 RepID=A0ABW5BGE8_9BACT